MTTYPNLHLKTPLLESQPLSQLLGRPVFLKMECYQPVSSFKFRGLGLLCQDRLAKGKRLLVSSSGGNAGYTVAYIGKHFDVKVVVFVPKITPEIFVRQIRDMGATVFQECNSLEEAHELATAYAQKHDGAFIPPFNDPLIWQGHSSMVDELVNQLPEKPGGIIVSVGGGGMLCGLLQGLHRHHWNDVPIFATEPEGADSFAVSLKMGKIVAIDKTNTVAVTLASKQPMQALQPWLTEHPISALLSTDKQAVNACYHFANDHRVLVEPSCGIALAPVYEKNPALQNLSSVVVIVCGGIGISFDFLQTLRKQFTV